MHVKFLLEKLVGRDYSADLSINGTILKLILNEVEWRLDSTGFGHESVARAYKHSKEPSDTIKYRK